MAEVLGTVASGKAVGTLAGKVASCVLKLKSFWDQVKDAPTEISYLVREIDTLNLILIHMQESSSLPDLVFNSAMLNYSLRQCEEGVNELDNLVQELAMKLEGKNKFRKKVGAAKVVLKQDDLNRFKSRMESAIRMLSLAYQCHTNTMIQLQPEIIVARVAHHLQSTGVDQVSPGPVIELIRSDEEEIPKTATHDLVTRQYDTWVSSMPWMKYLLGSFEYPSRSRLHKGKPKQEFEAKYRLPCWISQTALHVQGYNYLSQWRINYHAYRVMPDDSSFFEAIRAGSIQTVQQMIAHKTAFVTDRSIYGEQTILHISLQRGHVMFGV